ncbi:MAG TPA: N-acetylmuramic acid 6-phosphate etherase [Planctomycetes bacterium]|nr:N-acetylmuramic acid 6-phosphate etherase [Planctomycetota bacterium]
MLTGAGTSGRLAVLEAAECLPTFGSEDVVGLIAGGESALLRAKEGAEDDRAGGRAAAEALELSSADFLLGVTASGRTPFVWGTLDAAQAAGAPSGLLCCSPPPADAPPRTLTIHLATGAEVLSGSTRLKAGTATKCALNAISTGAMAQLGKVYDDLMVDVIAGNAKLRLRAARIVATLVECDEERARALLAACGGEAKPAIVAGRLGLEPAEARARLSASGGHLRRALRSSPAGEGA